MFLGRSSSVVGPRLSKQMQLLYWGNDNMIGIFWKIEDRCGPLEEQEYFELRLLDSGTIAKLRFVIREVHAAWSDRARQVTLNRFEDDNCRTPEEAQQCYDNRKVAILANGFMSSEMELSKAP